MHDGCGCSRPAAIGALPDVSIEVRRRHTSGSRGAENEGGVQARVGSDAVARVIPASALSTTTTTTTTAPSSSPALCPAQARLYHNASTIIDPRRPAIAALTRTQLHR